MDKTAYTRGFGSPQACEKRGAKSNATRCQVPGNDLMRVKLEPVLPKRVYVVEGDKRDANLIGEKHHRSQHQAMVDQMPFFCL